jgi:hypothetical protein
MRSGLLVQILLCHKRSLPQTRSTCPTTARLHMHIALAHRMVSTTNQCSGLPLVSEPVERSCPALLSCTAPGGVAEAPRLEAMSAAKAAEVRWWRLQRLKLLALNDRLETCMVGVLGWAQGSGLCAGTAGRLCFQQVIGLCMLGSRAQGCAGVRMGDVLGTYKTSDCSACLKHLQ